MRIKNSPWFLRYWWLPAVCFYGMEVCHEAGHVLAGIATGAKLECVELLPWQLSRTGFFANPQPGIVVWMGPVIGILLPLCLWMVFRHWRSAHFLRFFAGFALIANGVYTELGL